MKNKDVSFLYPPQMRELGFIEKEEGSDWYYKYVNNGTVHYNTDYNANFAEPPGKVEIWVSTIYQTLSGDIVPYIVIYQDGKTRISYNGLCPTKEFLVSLLHNIR